MDVCFCVDVLIQTRTAFLRDGQYVYDPREILVHYLRTWFAIDLLAGIPIARIAQAASGIERHQNSSASSTTAGALRANNLLRLLRITRVFRLVKAAIALVKLRRLVHLVEGRSMPMCMCAHANK